MSEEADLPSLLSNKDIDNLFSNKSLSNFGYRLKGYGGCFMKHELRKMTPENKIYFINLDEKGGSGTHWVLVSNYDSSGKSGNKIFYFNSFGLPPCKDVIDFMKRAKDTRGKGKIILYNTIQLQDIDSVNCGYYCVYVGKQLLKQKKFMDIIAKFHLGFEPWLNETLVESLKFGSMFNAIRPEEDGPDGDDD